MFNFTVAELYCSDAATSNVHVIGRFTPHNSTPGARLDRPLLPQQSPEALRSLLSDRCLQTAKELVANYLVATPAAPLPAEEAEAEEAAGGSSLSAAAMKLRLWLGGMPASSSSSSQQGPESIALELPPMLNSNGLPVSNFLSSMSVPGLSEWSQLEANYVRGSSSGSSGRERLRLRMLAARAALERCSLQGG
jgi:hypothetical protein